MATASAGKRTVGIWAISIFYLVSVGWTLAALALVYTGGLSMSHAERAYLETLSSLDIAITFLIGLLNLSGAVALFMLRRAAFGLFAAALGASFLAFLWRAAIAVPPLAAGEPGFIGALVGFGLSTAVCFYTWRLMRRGMLV